MRESNSPQLISLFSIAVTQRGVVTQTIHVRISLVLTVKITGKLSHTFSSNHSFIKVVNIIDPLNQVPKVFLYSKETSDQFSTY